MKKSIKLSIILWFLLATLLASLPKVALSKLSYLKEGTPPTPSFSLKFINQQILPQNQHFQNIPLGGLSALTYDPKNKVFLALSDDKGNKGFPPRFYKFKLSQKKGKYSLKLVDQVILKNLKGKPFSPIDPEGIAILPHSHFDFTPYNKFKNQHLKKTSSFFKEDQVLISSEGAKMPTLLAPPQIFIFNKKGRWLANLPVWDIYWRPHQLKTWGVKENKAFEALSIDPKQKYLYWATESSLHQDDLHRNTKLSKKQIKNQQYIRISRKTLKSLIPAHNIKLKSKNPKTKPPKYQQYVYTMDLKIKQNNMQGLNGLTDFIALRNHQLLTVERAYLKKPGLKKHKKMDANVVRLFLTDCSKASDVAPYKQLNPNKINITTCGKTMIAELSSILLKSKSQKNSLANTAPTNSILKEGVVKNSSIKVDNIEGISLGPFISKKTRLLILVSDNNFSQSQKPNFCFFTIIKFSNHRRHRLYR